jgi:hypothetical protein
VSAPTASHRSRLLGRSKINSFNPALPTIHAAYPAEPLLALFHPVVELPGFRRPYLPGLVGPLHGGLGRCTGQDRDPARSRPRWAALSGANLRGLMSSSLMGSALGANLGFVCDIDPLRGPVE